MTGLSRGGDFMPVETDIVSQSRTRSGERVSDGVGMIWEPFRVLPAW